MSARTLMRRHLVVTKGEGAELRWMRSQRRWCKPSIDIWVNTRERATLFDHDTAMARAGEWFDTRIEEAGPTTKAVAK